MKKLSALFAVLLLCGWVVGCAPEAGSGGGEAPATEAAAEDHAHEEGAEHSHEGEAEAPAEGEAEAPAEAPAETPEAGSATE